MSSSRLGGSDEETTGIYLPLGDSGQRSHKTLYFEPSPQPRRILVTSQPPAFSTTRLGLPFRNGAGPFRALAKLSFRPRAYQIVPLVMALRQDTVRLLIADDVGVGKTIEALARSVREMMERARIKRFAVICLPHLCDQWQQEFSAKLGIEAVIIRSNTQARLDRMIQGDASVYDYLPPSGHQHRLHQGRQPSRRVYRTMPGASHRRRGAYMRPPRWRFQEHNSNATSLVRALADKPEQHLVMLTATPHSGKPEEFQSLLGILKPEFETLELPTFQPIRTSLARQTFCSTQASRR